MRLSAMRPSNAVMLSLIVLLALPAAATPARTERARANYEALREGRKQVGQLSRQELADVVDLDRALREREPDNRSVSQRCVDSEIALAGGSPSRLTRRAIEVKCRETGD